jgi:hypothetical protein
VYLNGSTVKECIFKMVESSEDFEKITLSYFTKDKAIYEMLKNYTAQNSSNKNNTNYRSKKD